MDAKKWAGATIAAAFLLVSYNNSQPDLYRMRTNTTIYPGTKAKTEAYGPSMAWLDRVMNGASGSSKYENATKLDMKILSSMMVAGMASGFRSQVANLLWMQYDEYSDAGQQQRVVPIMEAVVTLDPNFIDAWSVTGWHWAYNLYADEADKTLHPNRSAAEIRKRQDYDVNVGLDYLTRGAAANPDTYRLWFDAGYTRANKAGLLDEEAVRLLRLSRLQKDARVTQLSDDKTGRSGDIIGHQIAHIYEGQPDISKALAAWKDTILLDDTSKLPAAQQIRPADIAMLEAAGEYWGRYGTHYDQIVLFYNSSDAGIKAQIKKLIPDVERMVAAQAVRDRTSITQPTPTGAYTSLVARYLPTWRLYETSKTEQAILTIIGVMNANPKYHLQGLPVLAQILAMRGDGPAQINALLEDSRQTERIATQSIGLHFLAKLYEKAASEAKGAEAKNFYDLAHQTWYRARVRNQLDFYAKANTYRLEDKYGFPEPTALVAEIKKSRRNGVPQTAPPPPSMVAPQ